MGKQLHLSHAPGVDGMPGAFFLPTASHIYYNEHMGYDTGRARIAIRNGKIKNARALLRQDLERDAHSAEAWYLLSFSEPILARRRDYLKTALRLDPTNELAREWLEYLDGLPEELNLAQRAELLGRTIGIYLPHGWRVEAKTDTTARMVRNKEFSESSCCLFGIFYLGKRAGDKPETLFIEVTPDASVLIY